MRFLFLVYVCFFSVVHANSNLSISLEQQASLGIRTTLPVADDVNIRASVMGVVQQAPNALFNVAKPFGLQVKQLNVRVGDYVKQGQVLALVFVPELQKREHQYHNALSSEQLLRQKKQREAQLFKEGIIAAKQFEVTQMEHLQAQENVLAIFTELARMGLSEAELALLKDPRNRHLEGTMTLNAPMDGQVQQIHLTQGDSFDAHQSLITLLVNHALTVEMALTSDQLGQLQVGDKLKLSDGTPIQIILIQNKLSDAQKVMVTASFHHHRFRAGERVYVLINQDQTSKSSQTFWRLPRQAVIYLNNRPHIFLLNQQQLSVHEVGLIKATREGWVVETDRLTEQTAVVVSGTAAVKAIYNERLNP